MKKNRKWIMIPAPLLLCMFLAVVAARPMNAVGRDGYGLIAEDGIIKSLPSTACVGDTVVIHGFAREQMLYKVEMVYWGTDENEIGGGPHQEAHLGTFEATGDWTFTFRIPETLSIRDSDQLTVPTHEGKYIVAYDGNSAHINSGAGGTFHIVVCSSQSSNLPETGAPFWLLLSGLPLAASGLAMVLKRKA